MRAEIVEYELSDRVQTWLTNKVPSPTAPPLFDELVLLGSEPLGAAPAQVALMEKGAAAADTKDKNVHFPQDVCHGVV